MICNGSTRSMARARFYFLFLIKVFNSNIKKPFCTFLECRNHKRLYGCTNYDVGTSISPISTVWSFRTAEVWFRNGFSETTDCGAGIRMDVGSRRNRRLIQSGDENMEREDKIIPVEIRSGKRSCTSTKMMHH
jgi:hypothetical protein